MSLLTSFPLQVYFYISPSASFESATHTKVASPSWNVNVLFVYVFFFFFLISKTFDLKSTRWRIFQTHQQLRNHIIHFYTTTRWMNDLLDIDKIIKKSKQYNFNLEKCSSEIQALLIILPPLSNWVWYTSYAQWYWIF